MASPFDPYRTLGWHPGRRYDPLAYRRLAGEPPTRRGGRRGSLAIQAAYEMLTEGRGGSRPAAAAVAQAARQCGGAPWARPARARIDSRRGSAPAYRRERTAGGSATRGRASTGRAGATGGGAATGSGAGAGAPGGERPPGQTRRPGTGRRSPNKATLGSTSYDAAEDEPFEPEWAGGTWYGASSGTYWTLNPKEYADPRKHGPEYQRRARRRLDGLEPEEDGDDPSFSGEGFGGPESETAAGGERRREGFDGRWAYQDETDEPPGRAEDDDGSVWVRWSPDPDADADAVHATQTARPALDEIATILAGRVSSPVGRVVSSAAPIAAVIAWSPAIPRGRFTRPVPIRVSDDEPPSPSTACSSPRRGAASRGLRSLGGATVPAAVILSAWWTRQQRRLPPPSSASSHATRGRAGRGPKRLAAPFRG
jgi:hypothetical protein